MRMLVSEALGPQLDWMFGRVQFGHTDDLLVDSAAGKVLLAGPYRELKEYSPSSIETLASLLIERQHYEVTWLLNSGEQCQVSSGPFPRFDVVMQGPSLIVATLRCHIGSNLGLEVEVPESLLTVQQRAAQRGLRLVRSEQENEQPSEPEPRERSCEAGFRERNDAP
jgi:hypothetical protein